LNQNQNGDSSTPPKKNPKEKKIGENVMKCPKCGANIEVTRFKDGSVLIRRDCTCEQDSSIPKAKEEVVGVKR